MVSTSLYFLSTKSYFCPASPSINRQAQVQSCTLSRIYTVCDLNDAVQTFIPAPPPYIYHADGDTNPENEHNGFVFCQTLIHEHGKYCELEIDEISPDEDDRAAEAVLHNPGMYTSSNHSLITA